MRALIVLPALVLLAGPALAQSATQGPLAAPDETPSTPAKPKVSPHKAAHRKAAKTAHREKPADGSASDPGVPAAHPVAHVPGVADPADPVSFGMKWNGNSDDARQTRIQNYGGDAEGAGAEVGMKLHF